MSLLRCVIVEDEIQPLKNLTTMLPLTGKNVQIEGIAKTVTEATKLIDSTSPDLVFLDINLPDGTGFDVLNQVKFRQFRLVITTAFEEYALKAIKYSALDYLVKPFSPEDLILALKKAERNLYDDTQNIRINSLIDNVNNLADSVKKVVLKTADSIYLTNTADIIRCEADGPYTMFYLAAGKRIMVSKPLKEYDQMFEDQGFFRCHQSHLINFKQIDRYDKTDGGMLILKNGDKIPVSTRKKDQLLSLFDRLSG